MDSVLHLSSLASAPNGVAQEAAVSPTRPTSHVKPAQSKQRLDALDFLRGLVMVIMALDHVRFFLHRDVLLGLDPLDLSHTTPAVFFTRWITHFCAPVFVFLAGTSALLLAQRGKTKSETAWFLVTRGAWLILLEFTIVRFGWTFNFDYHLTFAVVLWALGWSMIVLAALIYLPVWATTTFGIVMVAGHNLLDQIRPESLGSLRWLWLVLHDTGALKLSGARTLVVTYPLIPWIGVMAAGYGFGTLLLKERSVRRTRLLKLGLGLTVAFVMIRAINLYGDPEPWRRQGSWFLTLFSFINCEKYPPSLLFLLMTLGPSITLMALFDRDLGVLGRPFVIFGRVPMFYYLLHFQLIHLIALALSYAQYGQAPWLFTNPPWSPGLMAAFPKGYGYGLAMVYLAWIASVILLYPACRWFAGVKRRRQAAWLRYF